MMLSCSRVLIIGDKNIQTDFHLVVLELLLHLEPFEFVLYSLGGGMVHGGLHLAAHYYTDAANEGA